MNVNGLPLQENQDEPIEDELLAQAVADFLIYEIFGEDSHLLECDYSADIIQKLREEGVAKTIAFYIYIEGALWERAGIYDTSFTDAIAQRAANYGFTLRFNSILGYHYPGAREA